MPTPVVTLPKVANYIKNVGKSVKLVAVDYVKEISPNTSEFLETNEDLFKEIYSATRNYKETIKAANTSIKNSKVYEAASVLKSSLLEDLKTGNWYNKEREDAMGAKALDMDMDFEDFEFDSSAFSFDDDDDSDAAKTSRAFDMAMEASTKAQAGITVRAADMLGETVKASTSALFAQQERLMTQMTSGLGSVYNAIENVKNFMDQPLMTSLQNTKVFQEKSMEHYNKMESMMDELLKMQRNLYNSEREERKSSDYSNVVGFEGMPDLREYAKTIFKNTKSGLGPEFDMLFGNSFGENSNPLLMLVASPLKMIPELLVKTVIPVTVKQAVETFDESISGVFTTILSRLNKWALGEDGTIKQWIGKIFGLRMDEKEKIDTGKFKKGPVPFDGITKQAIVEVIPAHLRRIEAALTGQTERLYDMGSGKWTDIKKVEKDFKDRQEASIKMSFYDIRKSFDEAVKQMKQSDRETYEEALDKVMRKVYEDYGYFNPYRPIKDPILGEKNSAADYYDVDDETFKGLVKLLTQDRKGLMGLSRRTLSERESYARYIRDIEEDPSNIYRNLFNGQYNVNLDRNVKYDKDNRPSPFTNVLSAAVDNKGKNIFFYLQGIYGELIARRLNGGSGGTRSGTMPAAVYRRQGVTPDEALNQILNEKVVAVSKDTDENPGAGISDDIIENTILKKMIEEEEKKAKERSKANKYKGEGSFVNQMLKAGNLGEKWKVVQGNISALLAKPSLALTSLLEKADARVYTLLFGKEEMAKIEEEFDKSPRGIVDYITLKLQETFSNVNDWLDEHIFSKLKKQLGVESLGDFFKLIAKKLHIYDPLQNAANWVKDKIQWPKLRDSIKGKVKSGASEIKGSLSRTWGRAGTAFMNAINDALASGAITEAEAQQMDETYAERIEREQAEKQKTESEIFSDSFGDILPIKARGQRYITKRGLAVVSPGEMIIPATFDKSGQARQLDKEKSYASRFGLGDIPKFAEGTTTTTTETDSPNGAAQSTNAGDTRAVKETFKKVMKEIDPGSGFVDILANGLIGGGISLITGMVGGPILGAAAGSAVSIIKQSKTAQNFLFGEDINGERQGGVVPKSVINFFSKYFPDMKDFGIAGAVAGLFTPLGLVGGLMAGGTIGYLKNNDTFQDFLFGKMKDNDPNSRDGGLISKSFRDAVKKAAPRMLTGAAGAALFGPFGLLGNVALGSALGYASTTDKFHEFIFGREVNGERKYGVVQAIQHGLVDPLLNFGDKVYKEIVTWFDEKILNPLKDFVSPFTQMIKNAVTSVTDSIKDYFKENIGRPISDFLQHNVLEPLGRTLSTILKGPMALAKFIIQTPFQLLGFAGNNMRMSQIRKGTATDMTAAERVKWREDHPFRRMSPDRLLRNDKFGQLDRMLATQFEGEEGLDRMKQMRDDIKLYLNVRKEVGVRVAKMVRDFSEKLSDILNGSSMQDPKTGEYKSVYTYVRAKPVDKIREAVAKGDLKGAMAELKIGRFRDVPANVIQEVVDLINASIAPIQEALAKKERADETQEALRNKLSQATGGRLSDRKTIRAFMRNIDKEIDTREAEANRPDEEKTDAQLREDIMNQSTERMEKALKTESDRIVGALNEVRDILSYYSGLEVENGKVRRKNKNDVPAGDTTTTQTESTTTTAAEEPVRPVGYEDALTDYFGTEDAEPSNAGAGTETAQRVNEEIQKNSRFFRLRRRFSNFRDRTKRSASRVIRSAKDEVNDFVNTYTGTPGGFLENFRNGDQFKDLIGFGENKGPDKFSIKEIGGALIGRKSELLNMVNNGYSIVHQGNKIALAKDGKIEGENAKEITREQEEQLERQMALQNHLESTAKGISGLAGGLLGAGWETVKGGTKGLLNFISRGVDSSPLGTVFKLAKTAVGILTLTSLLGYGSELFKQVVWPFMKDTVGPWLVGTRNEDGILIGGIRGLLFGNKTGEGGVYEGGLLSGIANTVAQSPIGKFFSEVYEIWRTEGPVGFIKPILEWYGEGNKLFIENIVTPLVSTFVANFPSLIKAIGEGVWQGLTSWWPKKDEGKETGLVNDDGSLNIKTSTSSGSGTSEYNSPLTDLTIDTLHGEQSSGTQTTTISRTPNTTNYFNNQASEKGFGFGGSASTGRGTGFNNQQTASGGTTDTTSGDIYKAISTNNYTFGSDIGLTNMAQNQYGINTETGESLWVDTNGNAYYRRDTGDGTYAFYNLDGTLASNQNRDDYQLVKSNEYARFESGNTLVGGLASGMANNFLTTLAGFRKPGSLPNFSKGSIAKDAAKGLLFNPLHPISSTLKSGFRFAKAGVKGAWNAANSLGNLAGQAGEKARNFILGNKAANVTLNTADDLTSGYAAFDDMAQYFASGADDVAGTAADAAKSGAKATKTSGILKNIKNGANWLGNKAGKLGKKIYSTDWGKAAVDKAKELATPLTTRIKDTVKAATGLADDGVKLLDKIKINILKFFNGLAENPVVKKLIQGAAKILGTSIDDVLISKGFKTVGETLTKKIGESAAKTALKSLGSVLAQVPILNIALAVFYFVTGWNDAHTILGVAEDYDIPIHYSLIAALVNAVKNVLPGAGVILSFIDTSTIMNLFIDGLFPIFGWEDKQLKELRDKSQKLLDEVNSELAPEDRYDSIEEYNKENNPGILGRITNTISNIGEGAWSLVKGAANTIGSGINAIGNFFFGSGNGREEQSSGKSRGRSGRGGTDPTSGHVYQKASDLANKKFGNSTIGEAGCGPVAATNLINKMGGNMDVGTAASYAENGGFIDSTGGTTTDYFNSILNDAGIGGVSTSSAKEVYNNLLAGNPAVLLGNSGDPTDAKGNPTPFGSQDHYITAMGTDTQGNIIAEDPDLPQSTVKYKANEVMKDMDSAIIAGAGRGKVRRIPKRKRRLFGLARGKSGKEGSMTQSEVQYPAWVVRAYSIIYSSEGGYNSVNANDSGAMSIGRLQWNAGNAKIILQKIFNAMIQSGEYTETDITDAIGTKLYNDVMGSASFANRIASGAEKTGLQKILDNDISKAVQDAEAMDRIYNNYYMTYIKKRGFDPATQEDVVIYCCDMMNQRPASATKVMDSVIKSVGSASKVTIDQIYQTSLQDSVFGKAQYRDRRTKAYNLITGSTAAGTSMETYTSYDIHDAVQESDDTIATITSLIGSLFSEVFRTIYGDGVASLFGLTDSSSTGSASYSSTGGSNYATAQSYTPNGYGEGGSPGQKKVVNQMASVMGDLNYSLDPDKQNPDVIHEDGSRTGSCASTVGWAYRKALGHTGMSASSSTQSTQPGFTTIWVNKGTKFTQDNILQPGDVMYYNWKKSSYDPSLPKPMGHTEMYVGGGKDLSHGGPNWDDKGPVERDLDDYDRRTHLMMVRRFNDFLGEDTSSTEGDQTTTTESGSGRSRFRKFGKARSGKAQITANANKYLNSTVPSTDYSNTANYDSYLSKAKTISDNSGGVSYEEFLNVIIELLVILAKNSDKQIAIIQALKKNNINVESTDIQAAGTSRSGRAKLKQKLRSGLGREEGNGRVNVNDTGPNNSDISYIVRMMEALARD